MKKVIIVALVVVGLSSACTQRTCPTYAKNDVQEVEKSDKVRL